MSGSYLNGPTPQNGQQPGGLEPLAMLQAYRAGRAFTNPTYQRSAQYLPQGLPAYTPPAPIAQAPATNFFGGGPNQQAMYAMGGSDAAGPGTDGSPAGAGTAGDGGGAGSK